MPIYEYQCAACGAECEMLQKIADPPATQCPSCGKEALHKEVSAAGFRLKGGGWYETDFKSSNRHHVVDGSSSDSHSSTNAGHGSGKTPAPDTASKSATKDSGSKTDKPAKTKAASSGSTASA
ncbi:MAG: zinc ribbon domain-containing protein [Sinobacteraceae bacterium]|nr:zinc ribbon domain-containing protein [Nevskiaceae bacterium]